MTQRMDGGRGHSSPVAPHALTPSAAPGADEMSSVDISPWTWIAVWRG